MALCTRTQQNTHQPHTPKQRTGRKKKQNSLWFIIMFHNQPMVGSNVDAYHSAKNLIASLPFESAIDVSLCQLANILFQWSIVPFWGQCFSSTGFHRFAEDLCQRTIFLSWTSVFSVLIVPSFKNTICGSLVIVIYSGVRDFRTKYINHNGNDN